MPGEDLGAALDAAASLGSSKIGSVVAALEVSGYYRFVRRPDIPIAAEEFFTAVAA